MKKKIEIIIEDETITISKERLLWIIPAIRETISRGGMPNISYLHIKGSPEYNGLNNKLKIA